MTQLSTMNDLFRDQVARSGARTALRWKSGGAWKSCTWREWQEAGRVVAAGLAALGVEPRDRVAILANTRREWVLADVGILFAGAATVPIYQSNTPDQAEYILNDSNAKVVFAEDPTQVEKLLAPDVRPKLRGVERVVYFDATRRLDAPDARGRLEVRIDDLGSAGGAYRSAGGEGWLLSWDDFLALGKAELAKRGAEVDSRVAGARPEDICTIVYTSGTTGPPKGVVLTHDNFVFECEGVRDLLGLGPEDEQLLFLPLAHIFAKILMMTSIRVGFSTAFAESLLKAVDNAGEVRPTFMGSVPRLYEKIHGSIVSGVQAAGGLKLRIFDGAIEVGRRVSALRQKGREPEGLLALRYRIAERLVFSKVKARFGGRLKFFISGGAPLAKEIAEFFHAADILILEGYGLTETTAATNVNRPNAFKFGTVGPAIPGVEMKVASDGEILMRGRNIMREYYGRPADTKESIDADGWFHAGDIGEFDADGFLRITDRKKDIIVTAGGKNVAPQNLENLLKQAPALSQVMVHGDKRKFLCALVTLDPEWTKKWAAEHGVDPSAVPRDPRVRAVVQNEVDKLNAKLASYETIKKFAILEKDFTIDDGDLTPTLKVKRKVVTQKHQALLDSFYEGPGSGASGAEAA